MNDTKFKSEYYPNDTQNVSVRLRNILSKHLKVNLSGLKPEDRIVQDLHLGIDDGLDIDNFIIDIENEFDIKINEKNIDVITFNDTFNFVLSKLQEPKMS